MPKLLAALKNIVASRSAPVEELPPPTLAESALEVLRGWAGKVSSFGGEECAVRSQLIQLAPFLLAGAVLLHLVALAYRPQGEKVAELSSDPSPPEMVEFEDQTSLARTASAGSSKSGDSVGSSAGSMETIDENEETEAEEPAPVKAAPVAKKVEMPVHALASAPEDDDSDSDSDDEVVVVERTKRGSVRRVISRRESFKEFAAFLDN